MISGTRAFDALVDRLEAARAERVPIERTMTGAVATLDEAYAVQHALMARAAVRGAGLCGFKVGTTSLAAMSRLGITQPMYGFLECADAVADGGTIGNAELIAPRIEMELAFVTATELSGADCDEAEALAATAYVVPAFEIIDSRYVSGAFDVVAAVADNMSTARHVLGSERIDPLAVDLRSVTATLERDGVEIARGDGTNVLGDPVRSLAWLVRTLARRDIGLPAGSVVLSGGFADALPAGAGETFVARFVPGGTLTCTFGPERDA